MNLPCWGWLLITLGFLPGVYATFALLFGKEIGGLDENGEPFKPVPLFRKLILLPLVLVLLMILWPWEFWPELWGNRR